MSLYQKYVNYAAMFLALSGYTQQEFAALVPYFEHAFAERMQTYQLNGKRRGPRAYSDYHNCPLPTIEDKLFFILCYFKTNNLQAVQGALFNLSQPKVNTWIHCLTPVLENTLSATGEMPARSMAAVEFDASATLYFHDGTDCPIQRPGDRATQQEHYSGKQKCHTIKYNCLSDAKCKILFLSSPTAGKKHDKKLADECNYQLPAGVRLVQDTGFQGFTVAEVHILQPKKKPRGKELAVNDKYGNQWLSRLRIRVEHAIGGIKRYRIVKDQLRNRKTAFKESVFAICCGLHNFRLNFRPWRYPPLQLHLCVEF